MLHTSGSSVFDGAGSMYMYCMDSVQCKKKHVDGKRKAM
jgi:hypothetical protein